MEACRVPALLADLGSVPREAPPSESRWIRPDLPQWEAVTDLLARQHTHLYIDSQLGKRDEGARRP